MTLNEAIAKTRSRIEAAFRPRPRIRTRLKETPVRAMTAEEAAQFEAVFARFDDAFAEMDKAFSLLARTDRK